MKSGHSAAALGFALALVGCDPCAGLGSCEQEPRLALVGQIVEAESGAGVDGVLVSVVRRGGVALAADSVQVETSDGGHWTASIPVLGEGDGEVDVVVAPPGLASPYRVEGVRVRPTTRGGDALVVRRWVSNPWFAVHAEVYRLGTADQRIENATIEFTRTGGVQLVGDISDGVYRTNTDRFGRAQLFQYNVFAAEHGTVVGDLAVVLPEGRTVVSGVRLASTYVYRQPIGIYRIGAGLTLDHTLQLFRRSDGRPAAGVRVEIRRLSGIGITPATLTVFSDAQGYVRFQLRPQTGGVVRVEFTFLSPEPGSREVRTVELSTSTPTHQRFLGNYTVGPALNYFGFVRANGIALTGTRVHVRQTGGIAVNPASYTTVIDESGVVRLNPVPLAAGEAVFEARFVPSGPYPEFTVSGIRLQTQQADVPNGHLIWIWDLEKGPSGPPGTTVKVGP